MHRIWVIADLACISVVMLSTYHASFRRTQSMAFPIVALSPTVEPTPRLSSQEHVRAFLVRALKAAGAVDGSANAVAEALTEASLRGVDSHGIRLLLHYVPVLERGRINPAPQMSF